MTVTGLVDKAIIVLCALIIAHTEATDSDANSDNETNSNPISSNNNSGESGEDDTNASLGGDDEAVALYRLDAILDVLVAVEGLWVQVRGHVSRIPDFARKFAAVRHMLLNNSTNRRVDATQRKLVEKESSQVS